MCRRFKMIYNIEQTSLEDVINYVRRLFRIYVLIAVILIITTALQHYEGVDQEDKFGLQIIQIIFYLLNSFALWYVGFKPSKWTVFFPAATATLLCIYDAGSAVYIGYVYRDLSVISEVVSVAIQLSTLYILFKLRQKFIVREMDEQQGNGLNPISTSSNAILANSKV